MAPTRTTRRNRNRGRNPSAKVSNDTSFQSLSASESKSKSITEASLEVEYVVGKSIQLQLMACIENVLLERVLKARFKKYRGKGIWVRVFMASAHHMNNLVVLFLDVSCQGTSLLAYTFTTSKLAQWEGYDDNENT
jgi:hypothetical protein